MYDMADPKMLNNLGYLEIKWPNCPGALCNTSIWLVNQFIWHDLHKYNDVKPIKRQDILP